MSSLVATGRMYRERKSRGRAMGGGTHDFAPAHCLLEVEGAAGAGAEGMGGEEGVDRLL